MAESRGINIIKQSDTSILFYASLSDVSNAKITSGTTSLRMWHFVPSTGALETYDFNDVTFKTGAITTNTAAMTHRTTENSTYDTGIWSYRHSDLTGFTSGDKYVVEISHANLPRSINMIFQYGGSEGNSIEDSQTQTELTAPPTFPTNYGSMIKWVFTRSAHKTITSSSSDVVYKDDDATTLGTASISDDGSQFTRGQYA